MEKGRKRNEGVSEADAEQMVEMISFIRKHLPHLPLPIALAKLKNQALKQPLTGRQRDIPNQKQQPDGSSKAVTLDQLMEKEIKTETVLLNPISRITPDMLVNDQIALSANSKDRAIFEQRREVMGIFSQHGYGLPQFRQKSKLPMKSGNPYKNIVYSSLTQVVRTVEHYVELALKRQIHPFDRFQIRNVLPFLARCHQELPAVQLTSFLRFVRITYRLDSPLPEPDASLQLYKRLLEVGRSHTEKVGELKEGEWEKKTERNRSLLSQRWSGEMDEDICYWYLEYKQLGKVKDALQKKYKTNWIDISQLKKRFQRVMRLAFKRVVELDTQQELTFTERTLRPIIEKTEGLHSRIAALRIYTSPNPTEKQIKDAIAMLSQHLARAHANSRPKEEHSP